MILRRLYLYLVSAASLVLLAGGLAFLGGTLLLFVFNDPSADSSRGQLAVFAAMTVVALPVWGVHFWFGRRFAVRDPFERASALRRLYVYWACLVMSLAATFALQFALMQLLQPAVDNQSFNGLSAAQLGWATLVFAAFFGFHFYVALSDRRAVGEEGASATLRRWYMYLALLIGFLTMISGAAYLLELGWTRLVAPAGVLQGMLLSAPLAMTLAGALLWGFHGRAIAMMHIAQDRHSTLRAVEGFIAVAVSIAGALIGASQILYYILARLLGVTNPAGAGNDVLQAAAGPGSQLLVYGVAWYLIRSRLDRDAGTQEADRQAGVRRLYVNLASLVSLGAWAIGLGGLLWTLAEQVEAPIIGVNAGDWKDPVSRFVTLLVVGAAVWVAHWRPAPWAADRQSLARKLYVWAALLASVLAVLGGGVGMVNALLRQLLSVHPNLADPLNLDVGHYLAVVAVAAAVGAYHWRVLRADAAARPPRAIAPPASIPGRPAASPAAPPAAAQTAIAQDGEVIGPHARRYTLVVTDATEDDVHQALASLPPQASYKLIPTEEKVDRS